MRTDSCRFRSVVLHEAVITSATSLGKFVIRNASLISERLTVFICGYRGFFADHIYGKVSIFGGRRIGKYISNDTIIGNKNVVSRIV